MSKDRMTNDEYPKLSGIVFHPNEEATEIHDSVLSMGEMYQLQLQADLVVLSSCESGIGKLAKGEGKMAINRGFLYAGAKNVIYTPFSKFSTNQAANYVRLYLPRYWRGKPIQRHCAWQNCAWQNCA